MEYYSGKEKPKGGKADSLAVMTETNKAIMSLTLYPVANDHKFNLPN